MNISVVIPMYNRENTIESAVRSVLEQTVQPMEIIVVDDCSMDRSVEIVNKICMRNRRVRLSRLKKNQGAQAARNRGIRAAKGEWILFLDSDDELIDNALELLTKAAEKNLGYDVYYGDYYLKKNGGEHYVNCRMKGKNGNFFRNILFSSKALFSGPLVRKKSLEDIGLLDEVVPAYQEWDTHIRLSLEHKYYYIQAPLFVYNVYDGDTISKNGKSDIQGFKYVVRKNGDLFLREGGIKSIIFYYNGMSYRCNRWNDNRKYYYLCATKFFQMAAQNDLLQGICVRMIGAVWNLQAPLGNRRRK